jgi:HD-GYP domain-containing protein (c-di-GMP phosphodiesterase class II)
MPLPVVRASNLEELLQALKEHDPYTEGHSRRVASYGVTVARVMGLPEEEIEVIRRAGMAHDVGKLGVSRVTLSKHTELSTQEFEDLHCHPTMGALLLERITETRDLARVVRHHHEHWDGRGYPDGLVGEAIPIEARVILVVDAFDAMTTARPYDPRISSRAALQEIIHCSGQQFDQAVVDAIRYALGEQLLLTVERETVVF